VTGAFPQPARRRLALSLLRSRAPVVLLLAVHAGLLAYGATVHSPTRDEPTRLSRGWWILTTGRFDENRGNPPLVEMTAALPIAVFYPEVRLPPTFYLTEAHVQSDGPPWQFLFTLSRLACIPYSLVGAVVCWRWATDLYGRGAGLCSLGLWCFSPTQLAFGQLITCDATAAAFGVLAAYFFWKWLNAATWPAAGLAGVALGLALLSKMVWVILLVLWPSIWLAVRAFGPLVKGKAFARQAGQLALLLGIGVVLVNAAYGFQGSLQPLSDYPHACAMVFGDSAPEAVKEIPIPFPEDYVRGIEDIDDVVATKKRSYMRGEWKEGGWWYYYLYALLVKEPLGALALFAGACWLTIRTWRQTFRLRGDWLLPVMFALVVAVVSSMNNWSHHYRYAASSAVSPCSRFFAASSCIRARSSALKPRVRK
jgi:4-amino-4-deoxy-L-arabinose transferase-like glycosyltransferase